MNLDSLVSVDGRSDKTLTQDRSTVCGAWLRRSYDACASFLFTIRPLSLSVPGQFSPYALVGDDPLVGVTCLVRADTLASSLPPRLRITMAGLVSRQHVPEEARIYSIVYYP